MSKHRCRTEFDEREYPVPVDLHNALLGLGWTDESWHNDVSPTFVRGGWRLWVEALWVPDRECGGSRFTLTIVEPADAEILSPVVWQVESESEALRRIVALGPAPQ